MASKLVGKLVLMAALAASSNTPASAYNISLKGKVHERLTRLAEDCLEGYKGAKPEHCDTALIGPAKSLKYWKTPLARAVRWSDDPTRQIAAPTIIKFAVNAGNNCKKWFDDPEASKAGDPFGGLLCSSHFGPLQFMHAMRSSSNEPTAQTRQKMLAWAEIAYGVASGRTGPEEKYCAALRGNEAVGSALVPANFPYCEGSPGAANNGAGYAAWRVHTLFSMRCKNPFASSTCTEIVGPGGEELARRNATGALLHLVQDSFSQSHARRDPALGNLTSRIVCRPVIGFEFYNGQLEAGTKHGKADKHPIADESCSSTAPIHDAVTASAILLWHVGKNSSPEVVIAYLREHVLGSGQA